MLRTGSRFGKFMLMLAIALTLLTSVAAASSGDERAGGVEGGFGAMVRERLSNPDKDAEDFFRKKANAEGFLPYENMSEELQDEWQKWDTNHDGAIDLDEYKAWYKAHLKKLRGVRK